MDRRNHLDLPTVMQSAQVARPQHVRQFMRAARRKSQPIGRRRKAGRIGDRCHLDSRLCAIEEGIEHLRVHPANLRLLGRQPIIAPHRVGGGGVIFRHVFRTLAGGDDLEAARPSPIDLLADQGRLVAVGHAVDGARGFGFACQQRAGQHVGFDVDHDDVFSFRDRLAGVRYAGGGVARGLHDDLHVMGFHHLHRVVGKAGGGDAGFVPTHPAACLARPIRSEVGDRRDLQAGRRRHLRQEHRPELARADQSDTHWFAGFRPLLEQPVEVHA